MAELPTLDDYLSKHMAPKNQTNVPCCSICWDCWDHPVQQVIESSPICYHRFH
jgi:hypothetical protein